MADPKVNTQSNAATATKVQSDATSKEGVTPFSERHPVAGLLLVKIYTPFQTFFEDDAESLSALNESGPFDILPGHHNFITMLKPCIVKVVNAEKEEQEIPINRGLMHISGDKLIIFLDV
jgi:hypothetical protein